MADEYIGNIDTTGEKGEPIMTQNLYFNEYDEDPPVVTFTLRDNPLHVTYYFKPNWWVRLNMWLSGFEAEWHDQGGYSK